MCKNIPAFSGGGENDYAKYMTCNIRVTQGSHNSEMFKQLACAVNILLCMKSHFNGFSLLSLAPISSLNTACILAFDLGKQDSLPAIKHSWQPEGILQGMNILS